jgi:hypothetical protein
MAIQMDAKRRGQPSQPQKSLLKVDMDVLRREKRESRRREATQFMASRPTVRHPVKRPTQRYELKARVDTDAVQECYALKKRLPLAARKQFENEYNETPYGQEQQLIDKYVKLYRL